MNMVRALIRAFSISLVLFEGNTGVWSIDPGMGSFHVFNMLSICFRVAPSTNVYASMNVVKRSTDKKSV